VPERGKPETIVIISAFQTFSVKRLFQNFPRGIGFVDVTHGPELFRLYAFRGAIH
jgi:hypothetical protein